MQQLLVWRRFSRLLWPASLHVVAPRRVVGVIERCDEARKRGSASSASGCHRKEGGVGAAVHGFMFLLGILSLAPSTFRRSPESIAPALYIRTCMHVYTREAALNVQPPYKACYDEPDRKLLRDNYYCCQANGYHPHGCWHRITLVRDTWRLSLLKGAQGKGCEFTRQTVLVLASLIIVWNNKGI